MNLINQATSDVIKRASIAFIKWTAMISGYQSLILEGSK